MYIYIYVQIHAHMHTYIPLVAAALISSVAFNACDKDICMLLWPEHNHTSPKRMSVRVRVPPLPGVCVYVCVCVCE
jgi:hypothetical protein